MTLEKVIAAGVLEAKDEQLKVKTTKSKRLYRAMTCYTPMTSEGVDTLRDICIASRMCGAVVAAMAVHFLYTRGNSYRQTPPSLGYLILYLIAQTIIHIQETRYTELYIRR